MADDWIEVVYERVRPPYQAPDEKRLVDTQSDVGSREMRRDRPREQQRSQDQVQEQSRGPFPPPQGLTEAR
jgi:hypothetical protein